MWMMADQGAVKARKAAFSLYLFSLIRPMGKGSNPGFRENISATDRGAWEPHGCARGTELSVIARPGSREAARGAYHLSEIFK